MMSSLRTGLALLLLGASSAVAIAEPDCRRRPVVDVETGLRLSGIEDLVRHPPSDTLILSARDRWGEEDGVPNAPRGLYQVALTDLADGRDAVPARRLDHKLGLPEPMRPHGIAVGRASDGGWRLLVVNHYRLADESGEGERAATLIQEFVVAADGTLSPGRRYENASLCAANDLDWLDDDHAIVSLDRKACSGISRVVELGLALRRGRVAVVDLATGAEPNWLDEGLGFPNGVAVAHGDPVELFVAVTRELAIRKYRDNGRGDWALMQEIELDGGPDNLAWDGQGDLLVAVHSSIIRFGLYSRRVPGFRRAPSRLVRLAPDGTQRPVIDRTGDGALSGATSFIGVDGLIVGGAAFDTDLMVCRETGHGD